MRIGDHGRIPDDLRQHISSRLRERVDPIAADAAAVFSRSGTEPLGDEHAGDLARLLVELLATAVEDGGLDGRRGFVSHVRSAAAERTIGPKNLFAFCYFCETAALDELALDPDIGAPTEPWPLAAQLVRRASFDALAALASPSDDASGHPLDPTTALLTRAVFDVVLAKETERACRFGDPLALIVFALDRAGDLDRRHGHGVAAQVVDRLGVLIRGYFRRHDWIGRYAPDSVAVILTRTDAAHAGELAEHVRATVEQRLGFADHRTGDAVTVTVSAAIVELPGRPGTSVDFERLIVEAEAALGRARREGGNRLERIAGRSLSRTLLRNSPSA